MRAGGGRTLLEAEGAEVEEAEDAEEVIDPIGPVDIADPVEETPIRLPGAGTQIAA